MWYKVIFVYIFLLCLYTADGSCPKIIHREEWEARQGVSKPLIIQPPTHVVIHHSGTPTCTIKENCAALVRSLQKHHIEINHWGDIGYNFLIGEDGNIYEGVGWDKSATHARGYDSRSLGICIIGDYTTWMPNDKAMRSLKKLINCGVSSGYISSNYRLIGHRQIERKECPGMKLYQQIKRWPHWSPY